MTQEAQVGRKDQEPILKGFGIVNPDTFALWEKAAEDTGVVITNVAREGEYYRGQIIRRIPANTVRFDHSATPENQEKWETRRKELERMLHGRVEVPEDLRGVIDQARGLRTKRLASYRRPSPSAHII